MKYQCKWSEKNLHNLKIALDLILEVLKLELLSGKEEG